MAYGRKVDNLRRRYADFLWNGEFLDVLGATVKGDNIRYTVFRNLKNGKEGRRRLQRRYQKSEYGERKHRRFVRAAGHGFARKARAREVYGFGDVRSAVGGRDYGKINCSGPEKGNSAVCG